MSLVVITKFKNDALIGTNNYVTVGVNLHTPKAFVATYNISILLLPQRLLLQPELK